MNVLQRIQRTAEQDPGRMVFRSRFGTMTYGELWEKSGRLARWLQNELGDGRTPIPVFGHKEPLLLVCFIAAVRSGRAYCPLDRNMPLSRIHTIANITESPLILTCRPLPELESSETAGRAGAQDAAGSDSSTGSADSADSANSDSMQAGNRPACPPLRARVINMDEIERICSEGPAIDDKYRLRPEDVHYIIFTSGSTGNPKGVQITNSALSHYLDWCTRLSGMDGGVFLNQAPYSFDLSVMDLYCALTTGSGIVSIDKDMEQDMPMLIGFLTGSPISCWVSTPSFADLCLSDPKFRQENLPELKRFLFCGETLRNTTARQLFDRFPGAEVVNTYGPTESTVCVTSVGITREMAGSEDPLSIGLARPGTEIRIETEPGLEAEAGESGEMVILGDTVGAGYFKEPEKTAKSFFMEKDGAYFPFPSDTEKIAVLTGKGYTPAYRTGDAGHKDEGGMLFYEGRIDKQIKFHGYRIELGDIENSLLKLGTIKQAAVIPNEKDGRIRFLTAFIVPEKGSGLTDTFEHRKEVRMAVKQLLPAYMVPRQVRMLDRMPLTPNGKVDRRKLESEL